MRRPVLALLALAAVLPLVMAPTSSLPSRPRFQSVGVNTAAPATAGRINTASTSANMLGMCRTSATVGEQCWGFSNETTGGGNLVAMDDAGVGQTNFLSWTRTGNVVDAINLVATAVTVNSSAVCTVNGVNCPPGVAAYSAVAAVDSTRTSTISPTCDSVLAVSLPVATATYSVEGYIRFASGGVTTNGWRFLFVTSGASGTPRYIATAMTNTSTANLAPTTNGFPGTAGGEMTALPNCASCETGIDIRGTVSITSPTSPSVCLSWAQNTSIATATSIRAGSYLNFTRLN